MLEQKEETRESVYSVTGKIIKKLANNLDTSSTKAQLAELRNSIGRPLASTVNIWPLVYDYMPEDFLGSTGDLTAEERAIITSLQLYALHQQGNSSNVNLDDEKGYYKNIGFSLSSLRDGDNSLASDRRFNAMITSSSFEELVHHLRQLIALLKSRTDAKVNYPLLAQDLYWFIRGDGENTRLKWARQYYIYRGKEDDNNDQ